MKDLPFAAYDFFGYIASGLVLVVVSQVTLGFPKVFGADLKPFDIAVTVLAVYVAGQMAAGPSKFFLEDLFVFRILGSPSTNSAPAGFPLRAKHPHQTLRRLGERFAQRRKPDGAVDGLAQHRLLWEWNSCEIGRLGLKFRKGGSAFLNQIRQRVKSTVRRI